MGSKHPKQLPLLSTRRHRQAIFSRGFQALFRFSRDISATTRFRPNVVRFGFVYDVAAAPLGSFCTCSKRKVLADKGLFGFVS